MKISAVMDCSNSFYFTIHIYSHSGIKFSDLIDLLLSLLYRPICLEAIIGNIPKMNNNKNY